MCRIRTMHVMTCPVAETVVRDGHVCVCCSMEMWSWSVPMWVSHIASFEHVMMCVVSICQCLSLEQPCFGEFAVTAVLGKAVRLGHVSSMLCEAALTAVSSVARRRVTPARRS